MISVNYSTDYGTQYVIAVENINKARVTLTITSQTSDFVTSVALAQRSQRREGHANRNHKIYILIAVFRLFSRPWTVQPCTNRARGAASRDHKRAASSQ